MSNPGRRTTILTDLQAIATIGAILAGGIWTYLLFVQQRQRYAHIKLEHKVTHLSLPDNRILLVLDVTHSNVGVRKVAFSSADIRVYGLKKQPDLPGEVIRQINEGRLQDEIEPSAVWTNLAHQEQTWTTDQLFIEPNESDQLHYEFVLSDDDWPMIIFTYYKNPTVEGTEKGWSLRTIYDPRNPRK